MQEKFSERPEEVPEQQSETREELQNKKEFSPGEEKLDDKIKQRDEGLLQQEIAKIHKEIEEVDAPRDSQRQNERDETQKGKTDESFWEKSLRKIRNRSLHALWNVLPKKYENLEDAEIPYIYVPKFLLPGSNNGMVLYHKPTDKSMIFITKDCAFKRYTVYHEYREGQILREEKSLEDASRAIWDKIPRLFGLLGHPDRTISDFPNAEDLSNKLRKRIEAEAPHIEAFLDEIALAQKEMSPDEFDLFRQDTIAKKRM